MKRSAKNTSKVYLAQRFEEIIKGLGYFPDGHPFRVCIGKPNLVRRKRWTIAGSRKKCDLTPRFELTLPATWEQDVFEKGIALVEGCLIGSATPVSQTWAVHECLDVAYSVTLFTSRPDQHLRMVGCCYVVSYGGHLALSVVSPAQALHLVINEHMRSLGLLPPECPF